MQCKNKFVYIVVFLVVCMFEDGFGGIVVKVRIKINGGVIGIYIYLLVGQGVGYFYDIVLGIVIVFFYCEEFYEFVGVVFVRLFCDILIFIEEGEYCWINVYFFYESVEIVKCLLVQQVVIMLYEGIVGIVVFLGYKVVVLEQCQFGLYVFGSYFLNLVVKEGVFDFKISLYIVIWVIVVSLVGLVWGIGIGQVGGFIEQLVGQCLR